MPERLPPAQGVVLATKTYEEETDGRVATSVYCDVLILSEGSPMRRQVVENCMVLQPIGAGIHDGAIRKPRASRNAPVDEAPLSPDDLDGDHVLIEWIDGSRSSPVVTGSLPHPAQDAGKTGSEAIGRRRRLVESDGNPALERHLGAFWGMGSDGNFVIDLTRAYSEATGTDERGREPRLAGDDPALSDEVLPEDGSAGKAEIRLRNGSTLIIEIDGANNLTLGLSGSDAFLVLGDGQRSVAIAEELQALWGALKTAFDTHTHISGSSGNPTGTPASGAPSWDSTINSPHMKLPPGS